MRVGFTLPNGLGFRASGATSAAVHCDNERRPGLAVQHSQSVHRADRDHIRPGNQQLNAESFFDLALTARITNKFNLRFGANNIFDRQPPLAGGQVIPAGFGNGNTYPQVYDALGRYMFAGVTVDF